MGKSRGVFSPLALVDAHLVDTLSAFLLPFSLPYSITWHLLPTYPPRGVNLEVIVWTIEDEVTFLLTQSQ